VGGAYLGVGQAVEEAASGGPALVGGAELDNSTLHELARVANLEVDLRKEGREGGRVRKRGEGRGVGEEGR